MGRPRKPRNIEEDLATAVEEVPAKPTQPMLVDAEHTIKFRQPVPASTFNLHEEEPDGPETIEEEEEGEEEEGKPRRRGRNPISFRAKLKQELGERGIGGEEQLRLRVDRLPYYEIDGRTGLTAEKEFVRNFICQKDFVLSDEYLDEVAKLYGPGAYWFTLRHKTSILKNWHLKIGGAPIAPAAIAQPGDAPAQAAVAAPSIYPPHLAPPIPPAPPRTFKQELRDFVETTRMVRELNDAAAPETAPKTETSPDPEIVLFKLLARDESLMDRLSKGALGKLLGSAPTERDEWAEVAMEVIKSGQAPQIIKATVDAFFNGFGNLFPKGNGNGQAPMAPTQVQNQTQPGHQQQSPPISGQEVGQVAATRDASGDVAGAVPQNNAPQNMQLSPEDELIYALIGAMARQAPIPETHALINIAIFKAPWLRESIDDLINLPIDQILALVTAYHPPVAEMAHAREWLESLIAALTVNGQEGE